MDSGAIVGLVVVLVLIAAAVGVFFLIRARRQKERARVDAMSPAERERHDAVLQYEATVKMAEKAQATQVKARDQRLKAAEKALNAANGIGVRTIASYRGKDGSVSLTAMTITTAQGTFNLDPSVNAIVDTAGNLATSSRTTFTRVAAGGLLFGPVGAIVGGVAKKNKVHDNRELYLMIEGQGFAGLVTCNPDDGQKVRQFAVAVKQAALNSGNIVAQREQAIAGATLALETERATTAPVDQAAAELEAARMNTARIDTATRAIEAAEPADDATVV
jgi:hypothetical protein